MTNKYLKKNNKEENNKNEKITKLEEELNSVKK